ncbi:MAG: DNA polymerase III subunit delta, partial [Rhodospirillales bacterium]|nr:DNA polymerase III subunit delta [Rhodospirillales bacterium]
MKIAAARIDAFVARPDPATRAVLIYGPDTGLVRERTTNLITAVAE